MSQRKWVYLFDEVKFAEQYVGGDWEGVRALLGGKGAGLADMTRAGVPVPPGFTVTTETCNAYQVDGKFPQGMWDQELEALKDVEKKTGKKFGDPKNPLLVSCRSGAKFSMPGMMDTVLNIGLTDVTADGMVKLTGNPRFVYDSYRRLVEMFGSVVLGIPDEAFEQPLHDYKAKKGYKLDIEMTAEDWKAMTTVFQAVVRKEKGFDFPQDPFKQLELATEAVFKYWNGKRAIDYRRATNIPDDLGTAVNIVTMVFGNMGNDSGTGVAFTRNPSTGDRKMMGEYLLNAQGEDVVAGIRNTEQIENMAKDMPEVYKQFTEIADKLEKHYHEVQDIEFTIERGQLWILSIRNAKRTDKAAIRIALDLVAEGLIPISEIPRRVHLEQVKSLLKPTFPPHAIRQAESQGKLLTTGVNVSPGDATGMAVFDAFTAEKWGKEEKKAVILIRPFQKPDDVQGMLASAGMLTCEGGATSHAAVVSRQLGLPCIVGCLNMKIDLENKKFTTGEHTISQGDYIAVSGTTGKVYLGRIDPIVIDWRAQNDILQLIDHLMTILRSQELDPRCFELATFAFLMYLSSVSPFSELLNSHSIASYLHEIAVQNQQGGQLTEIVAALDKIFIKVRSLVASRELQQLIALYKEITDELSSLNVVCKAVEEPFLKMYLEDSLKNLDVQIADRYQDIISPPSEYLGPKILFVDDEPSLVSEIINGLRKMLAADILLATSAEQATHILQSDYPLDIVISDVMLPMADTLFDNPYIGGLSVCETVRKLRGKDIPILCLTVVTEADIWEHLRDAGANHRINKPALPSEIIEAVRLLLFQHWRQPNLEMISSAIQSRKYELESSDSGIRIKALWALYQLSKYDTTISFLIEKVSKTDAEEKVRTTAKTILSQFQQTKEFRDPSIKSKPTFLYRTFDIKGQS